MKTAEMKIKVSKVLFKKVPASELRLDDAFMEYQPKTEAEQNFKNAVETAIKRGLNDFWRPVCDPSIDNNGRICYEPGKMPAVGKSYYWWQENTKNFWPECGSRLGTKSEYIAFMAVLIKELVNFGKSVEWAWNSVCNDSTELGHYYNSKDAKYNIEPTGSREICGWCDLANAYKILTEDEETGGFWIAGGDWSCQCLFNNTPVSGLFHYGNRFTCHFYSCGWLVFDSCPD